ncbi:MAG: FAD-binding protein, partial [Steroidobacteraceae bacterium]|nr:FAD-binding protein [Steroidobacteraceae bacterium]
AVALRPSGAAIAIHAAQTVLATGGLGQLFAATTNPGRAAGDGLAMALAQGAAVAGLEFVQFHPTALDCHSDPLPLLTEALRGAGARLISDGEPFMASIHPRGDLAPRDIVARAVWAEQHRGRSVALDAREIFGTSLRHEFPGALGACVARHIDPAHTPIPITCAAHFHMGGIVIDSDGRTSLPGLWAAGEVAYTGLHGANRLASNSLLEAVVVGSAAGRALREASDRHADAPPLKLPTAAAFDPTREEWQQLRRIMWSAMGPVRREAGLAPAQTQLQNLRMTLEPEQLSLRLRFELAEAMIDAARARQESRGAHWREDYPMRDLGRDGAGALGIMSAH